MLTVLLHSLVKEKIKIELDNGESIEYLENEIVTLKNGKEKFAKDLIEGDEI